MSLVHCRECGEMISESAPTCPKCGAVQGQTPSNVVDEPNAGLNVLSFFIPLAGLIMYLVFHEKAPNKAHGCGKWALIGFIVSIALSIVFGIMGACAVSSAISTIY